MATEQGPKPRTNIFGYLDETGLLHSARDRFFGMGLLTVRHPRKLHRAIIQLKNASKFHDEFKFNSINYPSLPIYQKLFDVALNTHGLRFNAVIVDKQQNKINVAAHTRLYNQYAGELIANTIDQTSHKDSEYITILADDVSTSDMIDKFEKVISETVKKTHRRNALFGICRLESHAVSEIQLCDVLIGTVAYAYKMQSGLASTTGAKAQFVKYTQQKLNVLKLAEEQERKLRNGVYFVVREK